MAWIPLAISAITSIYQATQTNKATNKAVDQQKTLLSNLKYEPIDIAKLKAEATASAIENATQSLALERALTPDVAALREQTDKTKLELARQVDADLRMGGALSPDVINRVNSAGRVIGATSGIGSPSTVPLTASLLGIESINLLNQRRNAAANLMGPGAPPMAGIDPGMAASLEVADNAANNQFNAMKAGGDMNLAQSEANARTAQIGGQVGAISSLANLLGTGVGIYQNNQAGKGAQLTKAEYDRRYASPLYNPVDTNYPSYNELLMQQLKPLNQNPGIVRSGLV